MPPKTAVPYSRAVFIFGMLSFLSFVFVGIITALIALHLAKKAHAAYLADPEAYTLESYNNIAIGRICAVIGLILGGLALFYFGAKYLLLGSVWG